jgi:hypothetical protein
MDIVKLAEKFYGVELKDWQKEHLRLLDEMRKDDNIRIVFPKHHGGSHLMYIYMNAKELISNGSTNDSKY